MEIIEDIFLYRVKFPNRSKQKEAVMSCFGGYTVYIDESLDHEQALKAYNHAVAHILRGDCDVYGNIQEIEADVHKNEGRNERENISSG